MRREHFTPDARHRGFLWRGPYFGSPYLGLGVFDERPLMRFGEVPDYTPLFIAFGDPVRWYEPPPALPEPIDLAALAREEAARRGIITQPGRTYTNADLKVQ